MHAAKRIYSNGGRQLAAVLFCLSTALYGASAPAANLMVGGGGGEYQIKTGTSFKDAKFKDVIRQEFDFSCGSAALATLLTYHYDYPVAEKEVLTRMFEVGDKEKIRKEGFSLLDMKKYLASLGLKSSGYKEPLDKLISVGIPSIVLINMNGYLHFVVVKAVSEDKVAIADPALGNRIMARKDFEAIWQNGVLFVVTDRMANARQHFNNAKTWQARTKGRFNNVLLNNDLGSYSISISPTPGYY